MLSGMVVRNFLTFYILPDRTPKGRKSRNTGILGHFDLGRPFALREIPGLGRKQKICNFPVLGALLGGKSTFGGEIRMPQKFLPESAHFFYILRFGQPDPHRREIAKYGVLRTFWPRTALGT